MKVTPFDNCKKTANVKRNRINKKQNKIVNINNLHQCNTKAVNSVEDPP